VSESSRTNPTLSDEAIAALARYAFPGNVRELENILERALALCEGERIEVEDLYLPANERKGALDAGESSATSPTTIDRARWNHTTAARALGMTPLALRYRLARLGIDRGEAV
jgi:two-component system, NtrC family, response regulator PilR